MKTMSHKKLFFYQTLHIGVGSKSLVENQIYVFFWRLPYVQVSLCWLLWLVPRCASETMCQHLAGLQPPPAPGHSLYSALQWWLTKLGQFKINWLRPGPNESQQKKIKGRSIYRSIQRYWPCSTPLIMFLVCLFNFTARSLSNITPNTA